MNIVRNGLVGLSIGYQFSQAKRKEDEIRQGANHLLASLPQVPQVISLGSLIHEISDKIVHPNLRTYIKVASTAVQILAVPMSIIFGIIRNGDYESVAKWINSNLPKYVSIHLPDNLGSRTNAICNYAAENLGSFSQVAMTVGSVAMIIFFGNATFGTFVLVAFGYEIVDHKLGWVPHKISLFIETYMPILSAVGILISGNVISSIFGAILLAGEIKFINHKVQEVFDCAVCYFSSFPGPTMQEIDAPLRVDKHLSLEKINEILNANDNDYELEPAHMSKWVHNLNDFPKDYVFKKYSDFFKEVVWAEKYDLIFRKVRDDDRFLDFLAEQFSEVSKQDLAQHLDNYIGLLAERNGKSKERYLADWLQNQMIGFEKALTGERPIEGTRQDLDDAIENSAKILAYLSSLDRDVERVDFEDTLLVLAIEGGFYCARGIKRCTNELLSKVATRGFLGEPLLEEGDPSESFELKVRQCLQNKRAHILGGAYNMLMSEMAPDKTSISQDVHLYDVYRLLLSFGFFPLTSYERDKIHIAEFISWELFRKCRHEMSKCYFERLEEAISSLGEFEIFNYLQKAIRENRFLLKEEKDEIIQKYYDHNDSSWTYEETISKFHRLIFVMLGVVKKSKKMHSIS